jgi:hypothetical protein
MHRKICSTSWASINSSTDGCFDSKYIILHLPPSVMAAFRSVSLFSCFQKLGFLVRVSFRNASEIFMCFTSYVCLPSCRSCMFRGFSSWCHEKRREWKQGRSKISPGFTLFISRTGGDDDIIMTTTYTTDHRGIKRTYSSMAYTRLRIL